MMRSVPIGGLVIGFLAVGVMAAAPTMEIKASLVGVVVAEGLVAPGTEVTDGQPLVYVQTATQQMAVAAVAPRDGVVVEVLVKPGQRIERGQVIVRLAPK